MPKRKISRWLLLTVGIFVVQTSFGQELLPFAVEPLSAWIQLPPGAKYSDSFTVTNIGSVETTLNVLVRDFTYTEHGEPVILEPGTLGKRSLAPYITCSPTCLLLQPGESQMVNYTVSLPPDANGPHWAMLVVAPETPQETELESPEEGLKFIVRMNLKYLFTIIHRPPSSVSPAGQVVSIEAKGAATNDGRRKVTVALTFQNLVEDVLRCKVYFEVRDTNGDKLARYDLPQEITVLPGMVRIFAYTFEKLEWCPGQYLILGVVDFGGDYLAAGQYLATVRE